MPGLGVAAQVLTTKLVCVDSIYLSIYLYLFHNKPYSTAKRKKTVEQDEQGSLEKLSTFKRQLKSYFFQSAFTV